MEVSALWVLLPTWLLKISLIQVAVIDATFSSISSHHFVMEEPMKEVNLEKMFQAIYINDFNEVSTIKPNSRVMKGVYKKFPLKTGDSFRQLKKRQQNGEHGEKAKQQKLSYEENGLLEGKVQEKPIIFADYKKFMDDLIAQEIHGLLDHRNDLVFSHTMECMIQASLAKSEWSLIAVQSAINDH